MYRVSLERNFKTTPNYFCLSYQTLSFIPDLSNITAILVELSVSSSGSKTNLKKVCYCS